MKRTLLVLLSYRGAQAETRECVAALREAGARSYGQQGAADVALARSWLLSNALAAVQGTDVDTFLCIDDDMVFSVAAAQQLVDLSRASDDLVSAVYGTSTGRVAASRHGERWLTGMGFLAVPVARLREVEGTLPHSIESDQRVTAWCQSGIHTALPGRWTSEDYWFCLHFGGVQLAPIGVGHLKTVPLYPDETTLQRLMDGTLQTKRSELEPVHR